MMNRIHKDRYALLKLAASVHRSSGKDPKLDHSELRNGNKDRLDRCPIFKDRMDYVVRPSIPKPKLINKRARKRKNNGGMCAMIGERVSQSLGWAGKSGLSSISNK
jgi:hypothetical protein